MRNRFVFNLPNEKGVALLIVLASIMLLTTLVVEFRYSSNVTYNIAMNERERFQAFYLAHSALQFSKILIKKDRELKSQIGKLPKNLQMPLYQVFPINSAQLRGLTQATSSGTEEGGPSDAGQNSDQAQAMASAFDSQKITDFLGFQGDFSATIEVADGKLPLNAFYGLNPTQPNYDRLKNVLRYLFLQKPFEGFMKDRIKESESLATQIADYIDKNDAINEWGGSERGSEVSLYSGTGVRPKNAKLLTVEELIRVPGMTEDILAELKKHVTVYKSVDTINACRATDELLGAMIIAYTQNRSDLDPLSIDHEERVKKTTDQVKEKCPDTVQMGQALNDFLGASASGVPPSSAGGKVLLGGSKVIPSSPLEGGGGTSSGFSAMLNSEETVFQIEAIGTIGHAEVKIMNVLGSTGGSDWNELYWRVQ